MINEEKIETKVRMQYVTYDNVIGNVTNGFILIHPAWPMEIRMHSKWNGAPPSQADLDRLAKWAEELIGISEDRGRSRAISEAIDAVQKLGYHVEDEIINAIASVDINEEDEEE